MKPGRGEHMANIPKRKRLTRKRRRFVEEYAVDWNGTQAAIRAGYSARNARKLASENLTKLDILEELDRRVKLLTKLDIRGQNGGSASQPAVEKS